MAHGHIEGHGRPPEAATPDRRPDRGPQRAVGDTYRIGVRTQAPAATTALRTVALGLLDDHLAHRLVDAARDGGPAADAPPKEASDAGARLVRA